MNSISLNIDKLRSYANILSNSTFDKLVRSGDYKYLHLKLRRFDNELIGRSDLTYKEYFKHIFSTLQHNYRNEYVYKNLIINKILLGKYSLETTIAINEFKINTSIADLVLLNGTSKVFEIKTELDKPYRLDNQLKQYKKVFKEIYLVTHHSIVNKYLNKIPEDTGIIVLTNRFTLKTLREAKVNTDLDNSSMMKCLRKSEYSSIILKYFGELPSVSDFKFYKSCKELICKIPPLILHDMMLEEIKNRNLKEQGLLSSNLIPKEIKHICLCLDFNMNEYMRLNDILTNKIVLK